MKHAREILKERGLRPKESWGQNFLSDESALQKIADACGATANDVVLEMGPGLGHLTHVLLATGARVVAVEKDRDMVAALESQKLERLTVVAANAADIDIAKTASASEVI